MMNYLTKEEIQEKLKRSETQVAALFNVSGFPYVKIGRQKRVREDLLDQWLSDHMGEEIKLDYTKV